MDKLKTIQFNKVNKERVSILLSCGVSESHWILDHRLRGDQQVAIKKLLSWIMIGSLVSISADRTPITHIDCSKSAIATESKLLYNTEFAENDNLYKSSSVNDTGALNNSVRISNRHYEIRLP